MRDARAAKQEMQSMADAAKAMSAAEAAASAKAVQARQTEIQQLQAESQALRLLGDSARLTNQQLLYGGRNDMQQHLSDMDRLLQYRNLLNRAEWLNFSTPQQAMSFRQQMYQQKLLENKAEFGGYLTADQYLAYMAKRTQAASLDTAAIKARAQAVADETQAMLAYDNAVRGGHSSIGQLGEGVSAIAALGDALNALPDAVVTQAEFDDSGALAAIATYRSALASLPRTEAVPVLARPSVALTSGSSPQLSGGAEEAAARAMAEEMARLAGQAAADEERVARVIERAMGEDFRGGSRFLPPGGGEFARGPGTEMVVKAEFDDVSARAGLQMWVHELLAAVQRKYEFYAGLDDSQALTELDNLMARFRAGETEALRLAAGMGGAAGGGGGGGPPPAGPGAAGEPPPEFNPQDADAIRAMREELIRLAGAEDNVRSGAALATQDFLSEEEAAANLAAALAAIRAAAAAAAAAEHGAADGARAAGGAIPPMVDGLVASTAGWFGLNSQLRLFGGLMPGVLGHVAAWHVLIDFIIEGLAVFVPALVTLAADLTAFGVAGYDAGRQVYDRIVAIHTASDALQQTLAPMTGQLEKLHDTVRPMVWQLYGDAIDIAHTKTGLFNQLAIQTGTVIDRLAAHITVFATGASRGLETFFSIGNQDLAKLGTFFDNLGKALLALIKVTQETHVDQIFLNFFVALSQLLVLITKLPTPILAAAVGLHAFYLWGGLAATVVMQLLGPIRALAVAMGGLAAEETALGGLGPDASAFSRLKAGLADIGAGFAALPGRLGLVRKASQDAGAAAGEAAGGIAAEGEAAAGAAASGGLFGGVLAGLTAIPVAGWIAAAVLALTGLGIWLGRMPDATQKWIVSMDQALTRATMFSVVGKTMADLAATTRELALAQATGTGNATELANAQADLSGKLRTELGHIGQVSRAYGVDMPTALALLQAAGVKTSDLFTAQGKVWQQDLQQVRGLVDGYKAMGQGMSEIQRDVSVQLVLGSDQFKSMQQLNQAWDQFQQVTAGPFTGIIKVAQDVNALTGQAGSMVGLSKAALDTQKNFQGMYNDAETLFSALRAGEAVTGAGGFTGAVKDAVAALLPLAGRNKAAAAEISQLAQEAGGPATTNLRELGRWAGNITDPLGKLYQASQQATIGASNLDADAARLTSTLQSDLNPALAHASFNAYGGQAALNAFATDLVKLGPNARPTIDAGHNVAQMLLSINKNSASAKAEFVGWAESMGMSAPQADRLWAAVSRGVKPLQSVRDQAAQAGPVIENLGKPGLWGQFEHVAMAAGDRVGHFFGTTFPDFFVSLGHVITVAWGHAWSGLVSPVMHAFDDVKRAITTGFDGWWKSHGKELEQLWRTVWGNISSIFSGHADSISGLARQFWHGLEQVARGFWQIFGPIVKSGWDVVVGIFRIAVGSAENLAKALWDFCVAAARAAWATLKAIVKIGWDTIVAIFSVALDLLTGHWHQAWTDIENYGKQVWNALHGFYSAAWSAFRADFQQTLNLVKSAWQNTWSAIEGVARSVWANLRSGFDNVVSSLKSAWGSLEGIFKGPVSFLVNDVYDNGIARLWNDVMGAIGGPKLPVIKFSEGGRALAQDGGRLGGYGGGDIVPALLEPGEAVVDKDRTRKYSWLLRLMGVPGFQGGGVVGDITNFLSGAAHDVGHILGQAVDLGKIGMALLTGNTTALRNALEKLVGADGATGELADMITGIPKTMISHLLDKAKSLGMSALGAIGVGSAGGSATAGVETVARYIMAHGGTREAGAGVGGTVAGESGGNPEAIEGGGGGGTGLIQWTPGSSAFPIQPLITGNVGRDMAVQLVDMLAYINSRGGIGAINAGGAAGGPMGAAEVFSRMEAPLVPGSDIRPSVVNQLYRMGLRSGGLVKMAAGGEVPVPYLAGFHAGQAHDILVAAGLRPTAAAGQKAGWWTTGSDPRATTHVPPRSAVSIHASAGSRPEGIRVPDLTGYTAGTAHNILIAEGLVPTAHAGQKATWLVTGTVPGKGAGTHRGAHVQILASAPITPGPKGGTPKGMDSAQAWRFYSSQLPKMHSDQAGAFWDLFNAKLPMGKGGATQDQWAGWYADMLILRDQQQAHVFPPWTRLASHLSSPATMSDSDWRYYIASLSDMLRWEEGPGAGGANPPSSRWHAESQGHWPKGFKPGHIAPSNWPGWKFEHGKWAAAKNATGSALADAKNAYAAWKSLFGPNSRPPGLYGTPGVMVTVPGAAPAPVDLSSLIPGGPGSPVVVTGPSASTTGMGFAAGGMVGRDGASLSQVAAMFALGGMVEDPTLAMLGLPASAQRQLAGAAAGGLPRSLSDAAGERIGVKVGSLTINNPVAEKPSDSIARSTNRLAFLGGRGSV